MQVLMEARDTGSLSDWIMGGSELGMDAGN